MKKFISVSALAFLLFSSVSISAQSEQDFLGDVDDLFGEDELADILDVFEQEEQAFAETFEDTETPLAVDAGSEAIAAPLTPTPEALATEETPLPTDDPLLASPSQPPLLPSSIPDSAQLSFSVVNISQDNKDASLSGAVAGDILRYELVLNSETEDILDYEAFIDVSGLVDQVEFTDLGLGSLQDGIIAFPSFSKAAPCKQVFSFFVQVKECKEGQSSLRADAEGQSAQVPRNCDLSATGPAPNWILLMGVLVLCLGVMMQFGQRKA